MVMASGSGRRWGSPLPIGGPGPGMKGRKRRPPGCGGGDSRATALDGGAGGGRPRRAGQLIVSWPEAVDLPPSGLVMVMVRAPVAVVAGTVTFMVIVSALTTFTS